MQVNINHFAKSSRMFTFLSVGGVFHAHVYDIWLVLLYVWHPHFIQKRQRFQTHCSSCSSVVEQSILQAMLFSFSFSFLSFFFPSAKTNQVVQMPIANQKVSGSKKKTGYTKCILALQYLIKSTGLLMK